MPTGINLLPWRQELRLKKARSFKKQMSVVFGVAIVILALWHLALWRQINVEIKQIAQMRQELLLFEQQLKNKNKSNIEQLRTQQAISRIINLEEQRTRLIKIFENLHHGITTNAQLTQLVIKNNEVKLLGKAESIFGITRLIKSFAQTNYCTIPTVQKISHQGDEYDFALSLYCEK
jgi:Tfp pilus assembly protein PilN